MSISSEDEWDDNDNDVFLFIFRVTTGVLLGLIHLKILCIQERENYFLIRSLVIGRYFVVVSF